MTSHKESPIPPLTFVKLFRRFVLRLHQRDQMLLQLVHRPAPCLAFCKARPMAFREKPRASATPLPAA
jgi:hypothetical protein